MAIYLFVGVASGYVAAVVFWQVLYIKLFMPIVQIVLTGAYIQGALFVIPFLGAVFILMKASPGLAGVSRVAMSFLVGVGAAVTIAGALTGTIIPQVNATINFFDLQAASARNINLLEVAANGLVLLIGVVTTLAYFHFGANQKPMALQSDLLRLIYLPGLVVFSSVSHSARSSQGFIPQP